MPVFNNYEANIADNIIMTWRHRRSLLHCTWTGASHYKWTEAHASQTWEISKESL